MAVSVREGSPRRRNRSRSVDRGGGTCVALHQVAQHARLLRAQSLEIAAAELHPGDPLETPKSKT